MATKKRLRIVGVIPSRYASTRLPGKPLALIKGVTLIERVWRQAVKAALLDDVIIATDDKRIFDEAAAFGASVVMTSAACKSGTDRICEVAKKYEKGAFAFVNIQGDEPLITPSLIDGVARELKNRQAEMVTAVRRVSDEKDFNNPNIVKAVLDKKGFAIYFSRSPIPFLRNKGKSPLYKHIGIYGYTRDFVLKFSKWKQTPLENSESLEQLRALENGCRIKAVISGYDSIGVDTPEDIKRVEKII